MHSIQMIIYLWNAEQPAEGQEIYFIETKKKHEFELLSLTS